MNIRPVKNPQHPRGFEFNETYTLSSELKTLYTKYMIPVGSKCTPQCFTSKTIIYIIYTAPNEMSMIAKVKESSFRVAIGLV